ncbi:HD domain-containing protein [Spirochaetia bacterium]|nr:HD domain-containing protein [Spirochaetia bacterium]
MRSQKELSLDTKILNMVIRFGLPGKAAEAVKLALGDDEVQAMQEYANTVSIMRLGFNDHGPVHVRTVALNALVMMGLLRDAGIKTNLEKEDCGSFEDSLTAVFLSSIFHDLGMTIGRQDHELHSVYLAYPILDRLLRRVYAGDLQKLVTVRSLALECISGHMGSRAIHSLEAGVVQIADGCDMTKGRARIPLILAGGPRIGDIHQLSANSIEDVRISRGREKPVHIEIQMSGEVGLFQIEEVLMVKIANSTAKSYVELYALVDNGEPKRYL